MTFPAAVATIYRNAEGEVTGWDLPAQPVYCTGMDTDPDEDDRPNDALEGDEGCEGA
jgi:hypothetical protein